MRLRSQTQNNFASHPSRIGFPGVDKRAIGDASGEIGLIRPAEAQSVAHLRAQAVRADQEIGAFRSLLPRRRRSTEMASPVGRKSGNRRAEGQLDARMTADGFDQRGLQVGAVNDQIFGAPAALGVVKGQPHQFGVVRTA